MGKGERITPQQRFQMEIRAAGPIPEPHPFELLGKPINIVAADHSERNVRMWEREFRQAIKGASVLLLEAAPQATGMFTDQALVEYARFLRGAFQERYAKYSDQQLLSIAKQHIIENDALKFFSKLESIAAEEGVPVAVADMLATGKIEDLYHADAVEEQIENLKPAILTASLLSMLLEPVYAHYTDSPAASKKGVLTRRAFVQLSSAAVAASAGLSMAADAIQKPSFDAFGRRRILPYAHQRTDNPLGLALHQQVDARDVLGAEAISSLALDYKDKKGAVVAIYGNFHAKGMKYYAESPKERNFKWAAYLPYWNAVPPVLKIHSYQGHTWKEITRKKL